jgi:diguanylate cyclase (GGDEF)-like protein
MIAAFDPAACASTAWQVAPDLPLRLVVICGLMGLAGWSDAQRYFPGKRAFFWLNMVLGLWLAGTTTEHAAVDAGCKVTVALLSWPIALLQTPLWALFLVQYANGETRPLPVRRWLPVAAMIAALSALVLSNGAHSLFYTTDTQMGPPILGLPRMRYGYGPLYFLAPAWGYAWLVLAALAIVRAVRECAPEDRRQWLTFLVMMLVPWAANAAYLGFGVRLFGGDPTGLSFAVAVVGFGWLIRSSSLLKVVPMSRRLLFSALPDPVLVLDSLNRVVDCNSAGHRLAGAELPNGLPLAEWPVFGPALAELLARDDRGDGTLVLSAAKLVLDVKTRNMGNGVRRIGRLLQLRDVTDRHQAQSRLTSALADRDEQLRQVALLEAELRDQTLRDPLTGLHNRRALVQHFAGAVQSTAGAVPDRPLTLALLDIDHFKQVNDSFGHAAGDAVLQALGRAFTEGLRTSDGVYRIGGEEFALLMPDADGPQALQRLQALRLHIATQALVPDQRRVTFSAGVATCQSGQCTLDDLLRRADSALYRAKHDGRDRDVLSGDDGRPEPP